VQSNLRWRSAKFGQDAIAQSLGVPLARFRERHDLVCDHFVGKVAAIGKPKSYSPTQSRLSSRFSFMGNLRGGPWFRAPKQR
jgi:hypothetical protein